jgi:hypothetical protein
MLAPVSATLTVIQGRRARCTVDSFYKAVIITTLTEISLRLKALFLNKFQSNGGCTSPFSCGHKSRAVP